MRRWANDQTSTVGRLLSEKQARFRASRSKADQIFTLRQLSEKYNDCSDWLVGPGNEDVKLVSFLVSRRSNMFLQTKIVEQRDESQRVHIGRLV